MKIVGKFQSKKEAERIIIPLSNLKEGINDIQNYFILFENGSVNYVINKICDHAGGRLIKKGEKAFCPLHGWILDLNSLNYNDSHNCKNKLQFSINNNLLEIDGEKERIINPLDNSINIKLNDDNVYFRWLNHATVYFEFNGISLITDPWLFGPSFMTGWWLSETSPIDSIDLLKNADYVFISHNHPDHLHPETLACLNKDKKFIVADFQTKSTEKYLRYLGFDNINSLNFKDIYELTEGFQISIFKSGDFRDDSGIYLRLNNIEFLLTVDCNFLNSNILPQNIDVLMTSFAGGASGFPLCFNNYTEDDKHEILNRNRGAIKFGVMNYIKATKPIYYMPYAGMFKEYSYRDRYIYENNNKNAINHYIKICNQHSVKLIVPDSKKLYSFSENNLTFTQLKIDNLNSEDTQLYVSNLKNEHKWNSQKVINYFSNSEFSDNIIVQVIPTDDDFNPLGEIVVADFKNNNYYADQISNIIFQRPDLQVSSLYIRTEILMCVIENSLPWEDLSIGFQMRVIREPNTYESKFWFHFTNNYISKVNYRYSSFCGSCTIINQNPIWLK